MGKTKRVSKVASGRLAKSLVLAGKRERTSGGLKKDDLIRNKRGKIVSKRRAAQGRRCYKQIEDWVNAIVKAREGLQVKGFVAINGRTVQGKALYVKCKAIVAAGRAAA